MNIKFSRHATRRAKLYKIPENVIREILSDIALSDGEHEIIKNVTGFRYPIKTVVTVEGVKITVITNYPLKKGKTDERSL
ncbi:hypothetical protein [Thiorhodovibrio winogradskyi]|uniref:hypothetical protein n=1 Tax=Thiorhodovibrio winogradskyi TaxID=77007 RepID=UPI002E2CD859|nr:hypothetical protein [Thiorhodovibrio winogradskyi]